MNEYDVFKEELMAKVKQLTGGREVAIRHYEKANGIAYDGLTIFNPDTNMSPTVPLEEFYESYTAGKGMDEVAEEVIALHDKFQLPGKIDISAICNYALMKDRLRIRLLNLAMNVERLANVPYKPFLDLAACLYLELGDLVGIPNATCQVREQELAIWGRSFDEVYADAEANMKTYEPPVMTDIVESLRNLRADMETFAEMNGLPPEMLEAVLEKELPEKANVPMYVLSTKEGTLGAAALMDLDPIRELSTRLDADLYIFPSSIHEVILIPDAPDMTAEYAHRIVKCANQEAVDPQEVLSNHAYRYVRKLDSIIFAN